MVTKKSKKKAVKKATSKRAKVKNVKTTKKVPAKKPEVVETDELNNLPNKQIIPFITTQILSDDGVKEADSIRIQNAYREANEVQRAIIDDIFTSLCGWKMSSIIELADVMGAEYDGDEDKDEDGVDAIIIRKHCDTLGLGDKDVITMGDLSSLVTLLKNDDQAMLAQYIENLAHPNALQDLLVNTIYEYTGDDDDETN